MEEPRALEGRGNLKVAPAIVVACYSRVTCPNLNWGDEPLMEQRPLTLARTFPYRSLQWTSRDPDLSGHGSIQVAGHVRIVDPSLNVNLRRFVCLHTCGCASIVSSLRCGACPVVVWTPKTGVQPHIT